MLRRKFLQSLGLAATASIAFSPTKHAGDWLFPESIVPYAEELVQPRWIAAEALILLKEMYSGQLAISVNDPDILSGKLKPKDFQQFAVDLSMPQFRDQHISHEAIREQYLRPAMSMFANQLAHSKPKKCIPLMLPEGIDFAARAIDKEQGLDLRFIRAYDISRDNFVNRFDIAVA